MVDSFRGFSARRPEGDGVLLSKYKVHSTSIFVLNNVCKPARPSTWGFKGIQREGGGGERETETETETDRQTETDTLTHRDRQRSRQTKRQTYRRRQSQTQIMTLLKPHIQRIDSCLCHRLLTTQTVTFPVCLQHNQWQAQAATSRKTHFRGRQKTATAIYLSVCVSVL